MSKFLNLKIIKNWLHYLYQKIAFVLIFLLSCGIIVGIFGALDLSNNLIQVQAFYNAKLLANSLNISRMHYSKSAVKRLKNITSVQAIPNYEEVENAIPNPATFAIELGDLISKNELGLNIRLYSNYPFPNREKTGGIRNSFERDAIAYLEENPNQEFFRQEKENNRSMFYYAKAVIMEPSCIECHNTLVSSPKKDWKVGDVRGAISISRPLDTLMLLSSQGLTRILLSLLIILSLILLGILFILSRLGYLNQELKEKVKEQTAELEALSITDELTQIYNRRHFNHTLNQEWNRSQRENKSLSLILGDVDYFKKYNDTYGHQAGDNCLITIATIMKNVARRGGDFVARYGGEEFVIILPNTNSQEAIEFAKKLRNKLNQANLQHESSLVKNQVTISLGIATMIPHKNMIPEELIKLADNALYEAKEKGRNCYVSKENNPIE